MSFNVISFLKAATLGAVPVADNNPLPTKMYDGATGNPVSFGFTPAPLITTKTTTLIKSGPGMIGDIQIQKAGSADVITVYDSLTASGTVVAVIEAPTLGQKYCELYKFAIGCTIVTSGTTAGTYAVSFQ